MAREILEEAGWSDKKKGTTLRTVIYHELSQEVYTKLMGEKIRKIIVVYGVALVTAGSKGEGEANFNGDS